MKKYIVTVLLCSMLLSLIIIRVVEGMSLAQPKVCTVDLILHYKMWDGFHTLAGDYDNSELITNGNFAAWVTDDPTGWTEYGEVGADPMATEVGAGQDHTGAGAGYCCIYTSTGATIDIYQTLTTVIGQRYRVRININTVTAGGIIITDGRGDVIFDPVTYTTTGIKTFEFLATTTNPNIMIASQTATPSDVTFDDVSVKLCSTIFDYTFNNTLGIVTGGVTPTYPGLLFDEGVIDASRGATDNMWDGGGTLSIWLRPTGRGEDDEGRVFDKSTNSSVGWLLQCKDSDALLRFIVIADVCDGAWDFPVDITGDKWQHVVIVYSSDARLNNPVVYVDGVSVVVTRVRTWTGGWDRADDSGAYLILGSREAGDRFWEGSMDDVMLFSSSLEGDEARSIYESTRWRYGK